MLASGAKLDLTSMLVFKCFALRGYFRTELLQWYAISLQQELNRTMFLSTVPSEHFLHVNSPFTHLSKAWSSFSTMFTHLLWMLILWSKCTMHSDIWDQGAP